MCAIYRRRRRQAELANARSTQHALDVDSSYNSSRLVLAHKQQFAGGGSGAAHQLQRGGQLPPPAPAAGDGMRGGGGDRFDRESNEYASIWEWPLPNTPISGAELAERMDGQGRLQQQQQSSRPNGVGVGANTACSLSSTYAVNLSRGWSCDCRLVEMAPGMQQQQQQSQSATTNYRHDILLHESHQALCTCHAYHRVV